MTQTVTDENETVESEASDDDADIKDNEEDIVDEVDKHHAEASTPGSTFTLKRRIVNTRLTDYLLIFSKLPKPDVSCMNPKWNASCLFT